MMNGADSRRVNVNISHDAWTDYHSYEDFVSTSLNMYIEPITYLPKNIFMGTERTIEKATYKGVSPKIFGIVCSNRSV